MDGATAVLATGFPVWLTPELQVLFWALAVFFTLLALLWKFAWGPIMHALEEREQHIQKTIDDASEQMKAAQAKVAEYERRINAARDEAAEIVAEGRRDAEKLVAEEKIRSEQEGSRIIERAKREIQLAKQAAAEEIRQQAVALTGDVARKVLEREINAEDHRRFVQEAIREIASPPA